MDSNNTYNSQTPTPSPIQQMPTPPPSNGFSITALIMGICSLVFICCGGGFILGSLGIIFAILSRNAGKMNTQAKVGLGLSIAAFALTLIIVPMILMGYATNSFINEFQGEFNRQYNEIYDEFELPTSPEKLGDI